MLCDVPVDLRVIGESVHFETVLLHDAKDFRRCDEQDRAEH